ncbi:MAG: hypothetical protein ACQEVA_15975 [Myxococcota bacterium]
MSNDDETNDADERDTLPTGRRSTPTYVLTMIADVDWKRMQYVERGQDDPAECYFCEMGEDVRVRFERRGRRWQGHVRLSEEDERQTEVVEDMGKAARRLRELLAEVGFEQ